jgi:hypothetical protein
VFEPTSENNKVLNIIPRKTDFLTVVEEKALLSQWSVRTPMFTLEKVANMGGISYDLQPITREVCRLTLDLKVERKIGFYMSKVCSLLVLIEICACMVFVIPAEDVADRLGFASTMLLTAVAFQFVVVEYLPALDYLTLLDYYFLYVNAHVGSTLIQTCAAFSYFTISDDDFTIAKTMLGINLFFIPIGMVLFSHLGIRASREERVKLVEKVEDPDAIETFVLGGADIMGKTNDYVTNPIVGGTSTEPKQNLRV